MNPPLVSVIIPTYNRPAFLGETLDSVLGQTYKNIEIIVVDDGSPGSEIEELIQEMQAKDNIKYYKISNSGKPSRPRNYGFAKSKGQYLAFLDDDDIWDATKIQKQVDVLEANLDFGIAHCYCKVIDEHGTLTNEIIGKPKRTSDKHGDVKMRMIGNWTLMMPTPLIRRTVLEKVGLFDEEIASAEDVELYTRCSFHTKFFYINEGLAYYRSHGKNISGKRRKLHIYNQVHLKAIIDKELENNTISNKEHKQLLNMVIRAQIKYMSKNSLVTLQELHKLDKFWFMNYNHVKLSLFVLIKRRTRN